MPPTRILVADMPRLERETITELLLIHSEVAVVADGARHRTVCEAAAHTRADVVILGQDEPETARALLEAMPRVVVLTVADRELVAWRYGLNPFRERLGDLSPAALTAGIRAQEHLPAWWTD